MPPSLIAVPQPVDVPAGDIFAKLGLPATLPDQPRLVIGRREWLALPDLGVCPLNAKTDSGARSSSLHAQNIQLSADQKSVSFTTHDSSGRAIECNAAVSHFGRVRSSSGSVASRIFIRTTAALPGGFRWPVLISLANRADMLCPLLLGRRALAGYFLVDPLASRLLGSRARLEREFCR